MNINLLCHLLSHLILQFCCMFSSISLKPALKRFWKRWLQIRFYTHTHTHNSFSNLYTQNTIHITTIFKNIIFSFQKKLIKLFGIVRKGPVYSIGSVLVTDFGKLLILIQPIRKNANSVVIAVVLHMEDPKTSRETD